MLSQISVLVHANKILSFLALEFLEAHIVTQCWAKPRGKVFDLWGISYIILFINLMQSDVCFRNIKVCNICCHARV